VYQLQALAEVEELSNNGYAELGGSEVAANGKDVLAAFDIAAKLVISPWELQTTRGPVMVIE
jgi:hypothetical protein